MIAGIYVNRKLPNERARNLVEIPYVVDTIKLYENNRFTSLYWGKGVYNIIYSIRGTNIELFYTDEFGKASFNTSITRFYWGKPKLILDWNQNYFYEKIN